MQTGSSKSERGVQKANWEFIFNLYFRKGLGYFFLQGALNCNTETYRAKPPILIQKIFFCELPRVRDSARELLTVKLKTHASKVEGRFKWWMGRSPQRAH